MTGVIAACRHRAGYAMKLRKCPSCHDTVGADSENCSRCGVNFRAARNWRIIRWLFILAMLTWAVGHFYLKRF
jgi:uncharacterized paraquat-inducible protein A